MISKVMAMVVCVLLSGYFSATETAFSSLNRNRLRVLADQGNKRAAMALRLANNYDKLISTILIGNNIVNIAVASISTLLFIDLVGQETGPTLSTVVVTLVVLIFGEITPKSLAKDYPEQVAMFSAPMIGAILWLFTPLNFLFSQWKKLVCTLFRSAKESKMSQEELLILLDEVQQDGAIDEEDGLLLKNAVGFGTMEVQDILTPRVDLVALPAGASTEEIITAFDSSQFSRLPVFDGSLDRIIGVLHRNDFYTGGGISTSPLADIMTVPIFVHPTEKIDNLLRHFRASKGHLAVVVDEYGGTQGIVTMEDILEELVGEIWDEHDLVREPIHKLEDGSYQAEGSWEVDDFAEYFDLKLESDSQTLSGWMIDYLDRIPNQGDSFQYGQVKLTAEKVQAHRIETVRIMLTENQEE